MRAEETNDSADHILFSIKKLKIQRNEIITSPAARTILLRTCRSFSSSAPVNQNIFSMLLG